MLRYSLKFTHHTTLQHLVAFVVGNGDYNLHPKLKNPVADATAIKNRLEEQNAEVFFASDCGIDELKETFGLFLAAVRPGDAVFLFFACHATMLDNSLRLLAISDSSKKKINIEADSLNLDTVVSGLIIRIPHVFRTVTFH